MNIRFLSAFVALAVGLPLLASAAATSTSQTQATPPAKPATVAVCPTPGKTMKRGASGADVTKLQQFLATDKSVYPEGTVTGTYGPLTEKAVQKFQAKNKVVSSGTPETTGYGAVGPATAKVIAQKCSGTVSVTPPPPSAPATPSVGACLALSKILKKGSSGEDVTRLQQFLAQDKSVYPEGTVTGTYGPLTEKAVQRFQVKYGIVSSGTPETTGYGSVGPKTIAALNASCSGGVGATNAVGGFIAVAPFAGGSSRAISVQVTVNAANSCNAATYILDYGDNTAKSPIAVSAGVCKAMTSTVNHTYQLAGTYQVTLSSGTHKTSVAVAVN